MSSSDASYWLEIILYLKKSLNYVAITVINSVRVQARESENKSINNAMVLWTSLSLWLEVTRVTH